MLPSLVFNRIPSGRIADAENDGYAPYAQIVLSVQPPHINDLLLSQLGSVMCFTTHLI